MKPKDCADEESGDFAGSTVRVKIVKVFKDGSCHVEDSETLKRKTIKWRSSHVSKLRKVIE